MINRSQIKMDQRYLTILQHLEPNGIGTYLDISPLLIKMFPLVNRANPEQFDEAIISVQTFLSSMAGHIILRGPGIKSIGRQINLGTTLEDRWLDDVEIKAYITYEGITFLNFIRNNQLTAAVSKSVIDTNEETSKLSKRQNRLYGVTITIAFLSVVFPALSYIRDTKNNMLKDKLSSKQIELQLTQAKLQHLQSSFDSLKQTNITVKHNTISKAIYENKSPVK